MIVPTGATLQQIVRHLKWPLAVLFGFDMLVAGLYVFAGWTWLSQPHIPLSIFGGAIGVIVGFRNSSSYQRWWEARTLWGTIVNYSRTFSRQTLTLLTSEIASDVPELREMQRTLVLLQIAYVHALRLHLRGQIPWADLAEYFTEEEIAFLKGERNVPLAIQQRMGTLLKVCFESGWIDSIRWSALDNSLTALANAQGGAERIKNTPIPRQYDVFPQVFTSVYCVLLPLGMVANLQLLTPIGSTLVGLIFLALDEIGRILENPFENCDNDVPMSSITRTIEINLKQLIGEKKVPDNAKPVNGVLW